MTRFELSRAGEEKRQAVFPRPLPKTNAPVIPNEVRNPNKTEPIPFKNINNKSLNLMTLDLRQKGVLRKQDMITFVRFVKK